MEVDPLNMLKACPAGSRDPLLDVITWLEEFTQSKIINQAI